MLHNCKLKTEVIMDQKSLLVTDLNKVSYSTTLFGVTRLLPFHKEILTSHLIEFVFSMFGRICFIL